MDRDFLLVRKMKSGDETAMELFVRKYYPAIWRYCRCHVLDYGYAEDLAQETFAHFFRSLSGYRHMGKTLPWLYTIAGNLCKNFYGQNREIVRDFTEEDAGEKTGENLQDALCRQVDVKRALFELPEELREVVILHYFQELKLREIAGMLRIGLPLVKYRLRRAKEELAKLLGEEEKG